MSAGTLDEVTVSSSDLELRCLPALGAKIISLRWRATGRELLAAPCRPLSPAGERDEWADHDCGGWDECWPSISATDAGGGVPDHGDLWRRPWSVSTGTGSVTTEVHVVHGDRNYLFRRVISVEGRDLAVRYDIHNLAPTPLVGSWAMHPLIALDDPVELRLPGSVDRRMEHCFGAETLPWGQSRLDRVVVRPDDEAAAKVYLAGPVHAALAFPDVWIAMRCTDPRSSLGLWLNAGGWPAAEPLRHVALEPCLGSADDLRRSAADGTAVVLAPGARTTWRVDVRVGDDQQELEQLLAPGGWPHTDRRQDTT
jgi:galactose mutarotase-like enzyme